MSAAIELTESEKRKLRMSDAAERLRDALEAASLDEELAGRPPVQIPRALEAVPPEKFKVAAHRRKDGDFVPEYYRVANNRAGAGRPESGLSFKEAVAALDAARAPGSPTVLQRVMATMIEVAAEGDVQAGRLVASRLDPEPVGRPIRLPLTPGMNPEQKMEVLDQEVAAGRITPSEAATLAGVFLRAVELGELRQIREEIAALRSERKGED